LNLRDVKPSKLSEDELAEVETIIEQAIMENNEQQSKNLENHNISYPDNQGTETGFELETKRVKRQYEPVMNKNGQKEVYINFLCTDWECEKWKSAIILVNDGGNSYFNLKMNLETKTYSELTIIGYA
jgi:hypothetical protein